MLIVHCHEGLGHKDFRPLLMAVRTEFFSTLVILDAKELITNRCKRCFEFKVLGAKRPRSLHLFPPEKFTQVSCDIDTLPECMGCKGVQRGAKG